MITIIIAVAVVVGVLAILSIYIVWFYNHSIKLKNKVDQSFGLIDVYLKKRYDLIPNLVNVVKGYAQHEQKVFKQASRLMANIKKNENDAKNVQLANKSAKLATTLIGLKEAYPELKASTSFLQLSSALKTIEQDIAASRRIYNQNVTMYNNFVSVFPNMILTKIFKFKKLELFEIDIIEKDLDIDGRI